MTEHPPTPDILAPTSRPSSPEQPPVLPWEDPAAFAALRAALAAEHRPAGPTERHLVEQLAVLFWRKRRVLEAERALHLAVLQARLEEETGWGSGGKLLARALAGEEEEGAGDLSAVRAVRSTARADEAELEEVTRAEAMTRQALAVLAPGGKGAYRRALAALGPGTRERWEEVLADGAEDGGAGEEEGWRPTAAGLRRFLETEVAGRHRRTRARIGRNPAIRRQAFGESLDPDRAAKLQGYDLRLDRQLERTLALLLRLQELRGGPGGAAA